MIKTLKPFILMVALSLNFMHIYAQDSDMYSRSGDENIIIHKKDSVKEKITVVIDGNNITVNGKPIDDFTSDDIDIMKQKMDMDDNGMTVFADGDGPVIAPPPPHLEVLRDDMRRKIKYNEAFLGVMTDKTDNGAKITDVTKGSPAEKAGLKEDDIITKIGEDKVTGPDDLYKVVGNHKPDEKVAITYVRNGKQATATATLSKADQMKVYSWNSPDEDVLRNYSPYNFSFSYSDKPRLGISAQDTEDGNGVKILDVDDDDSPAAKAGLKEGDVITQVNGKAITSTDDLRQSVKDLKKGETVKITYKRNNQTQTVDVKFPKDLKTIDL
jgi:serine protease Do